MNKKRIPLILCALILLGSVIPGTTARAAGGVPGVSAASFILLDASTGEVLAAHDADRQMLIASTTKIMTAALVLAHCDPDEMVEIQPEHTGIEGSSMYLRAGETISVRDLLYGLMLASGNDTAVALAYHVAGGIAEFAAMMNAQAAQLGMENSNFENPHGLDAENHHSTARDMARLTAWALTNPTFVEIASTRQTQAAGRHLANHNKMLWRYPDAIGVKTGYTRAAGRSLVSAAEREGTRLICVTLSAPSDWNDHTSLLNWGFANFRYYDIATPGYVLATPYVISGTADTVNLIAADRIHLLLAPSDHVHIEIHAPRFLYAAVTAGEIGGLLTVEVNGEIIAQTPLLFDASVERDETNRLSFWEHLQWHWRELAR